MNETRLRELVVEAARMWPKTLGTVTLLTHLERFGRRIIEEESGAVLPDPPVALPRAERG